MMTLDEFNNLDKYQAMRSLGRCCVSKKWIEDMEAMRPFHSAKKLIDRATEVCFYRCNREDFLEAFTGHPKIGDVNSLKKKFADTKDWAENEQSKVSDADIKTIEALAQANENYQKKFGYIFIVNASGKSVKEMLAIMKARMHHKAEDEIYVAMNEQHKITVVRLAKMLKELEQFGTSSQLTTHALDTALGKPAEGMVIRLSVVEADACRPISVGITNADGRVEDVLAPARVLQSGIYQMAFAAEEYYQQTSQSGLYPEISIRFRVEDNSHYHIPLLISPYGYTTYRGS